MAPSNRSLLASALRDPATADELRALARRIVWWEGPTEAVADGDAFVAAVMNEGSSDEIELLEAIVGEDGFARAYRAAPDGAFEPVRRHIWAMRLLGAPSAETEEGRASWPAALP